MYTIQEINPCPDTWHEEFLKTVLPKIESNFDYIHHIIQNHREMTLLKASLHHTVYEFGRRFLDMYNILDSTPYYYIKYLLDINPPKILDIGCGDNIFKKSFPDLIIGMDSGENYINNNKLDHIDLIAKFDQKFVEENAGSYQAIMSINGIHFAPIDTISQRLCWVKQLLKKSGRAFVSFNIETWLMFTNRQKIENLFGKVPQWDDVLAYVNQQIVSAGLNFLVVDWPILHTSPHSTIRDDYNGNIRLVFSAD